MPVAMPRDLLEAENAAIEGFRRVEVIRVKRGYENAFDRGGHGLAPFLRR